RSALAREICEWEGWRNAKGQLSLGSGRQALPKLAARLGRALPAAQPAPEWTAPATDYPNRELAVPLSELGAVRLAPVCGREERAAWRSMLASHHPQGWAKVPGEQLRYWILSERHGRLGGVGFCAASWHQKARDDWIGWSPRARVANLCRVVNQDRFLILPGVRVPNLASQVQAKALARLPGDWAEAYGRAPWLAYTYVGPEQAGHCYRAAGWAEVGRTSGRPPGRSEAASGRCCRVWVKPLDPDGPAQLRQAPAPRWGASASRAGAEQDWAEAEYGRSRHPDGRLRKRLVALGRAWAAAPGAPIPQLFPKRAEQKAAYRFLSNPRVSMEELLEPHQEALADRCREEAVVLALQDTTMLNYHGLAATEDLVSIAGRGSGARGLPAHVGLAVSEGRRPLGAYELNASFRAPAAEKEDRPEKENGPEKEDRPEKESARWLQGFHQAARLSEACASTRVISVCDREGDFWPLLQAACASESAGLLVRVNSARHRKVAEAGADPALWTALEGQEPLARKTLELRACGGKRARAKRTVKLELRAARVRVRPPAAQSEEAPLDLLAVTATEEAPGSGAAPLHWMLLSTEGEATADWAQRLVGWYEARWTIEEYFKVLKSGTRVEDHQPDDADSLRKCVALDAITACRVFDLQRMAQDRPATPADQVVPPGEIEALYLDLYGRRMVEQRPSPDRPPDIRTYVIDLGRCVGFIPSRRQPLPGVKKVWVGYRKVKIGAYYLRLSRQNE
ncbi:MAG: IS4 family transposase, partial [Gammaproteobacteria bacterium]|nr:IS4 family transposase [Gammaproteobacteria bacterium]